jgi:hypothetical protein
MGRDFVGVQIFQRPDPEVSDILVHPIHHWIASVFLRADPNMRGMLMI